MPDEMYLDKVGTFPEPDWLDAPLHPPHRERCIPIVIEDEEEEP